MDWCLVEIEGDPERRARRRETGVGLVVNGHHSIRSVKLQFAWFESRAVLAGLCAQGLRVEDACDVPVRIRGISGAGALLIALRIFARKAMRHPRRVRGHCEGLARLFRRGEEEPAAYLGGEWKLRRDDYDEWIEAHEKGAKGKGEGAPAGGRRQFSIVFAREPADPSLFEESVRSIVAQTSAALEVCLPAGDPGIPAAHRLLRAATNGGRAVTTGAPSGDYLVFLDRDGCLSPRALAVFDGAIERSGAEAILLYADEDAMDAAGRRHSPQFKPSWSPDLLRSRNYIGRAFCVKRTAFEEAGGFREGFGEVETYDLLLRLGERAGRRGIVRIPQVLYHARGNRTRLAGEEGGEAGRRAIEEHVRRTGRKARVTVEGSAFRVRWRPAAEPRCSIIILTRDKAALLAVCLRSILEKTSYGNFEIVLVDNGSVEPATAGVLRSHEGDPRFRILAMDCEFNFARLNNVAASSAAGEHYCFLNNDMEIINPDWLTELVSHSDREEVGCVGAKLYYPDGRIQHAGVATGVTGTAGHLCRFFPGDAEGYLGCLRTVRNVSAVTAACLVVKRALFMELKGFDEEFAVNYNDVDLCLRAREAGYDNVWTPYAELYHHESVTRGIEDTRRKKSRADREERLMRERWGGMLRDDPFYSPNLTHEREDCSIGD